MLRCGTGVYMLMSAGAEGEKCTFSDLLVLVGIPPSLSSIQDLCRGPSVDGSIYRWPSFL